MTDPRKIIALSMLLAVSSASASNFTPSPLNGVSETLEEINNNRWRITQTLYHECGEVKCSDFEQMLIVDVIVNRADSHRFPNSVKKVIESDSAFSYLNGIKSRELEPKPSNGADVQALTRALNNAYQAYDKRYLLAGVLSESLYYYNPDKVSQKPTWVTRPCLINTGSTLHKFYSCALSAEGKILYK